MEKLIQFLSFSDPNVRFVVAGCVLLTVSSAIVGCFTFLRKRALLGDAVAHSVLPGVCLSFMIAGTKNPFVLLIGAFLTGWLSLLAIDYITRNTKLKEDTAIGLTLSVFFGIGILLLTNIQHSGNAAQSGLDSFLFGKAASLMLDDILIFGTVGIILIVIVFLFYKELFLISFDENFARTIGLPVKTIELLLSTLTVMAVVVGIQAVGVVLMAAMLITPAAAARYWTSNLTSMIFLAVMLSMISGIGGAFVSYQEKNMPTGPWIVMIISVIAILSFLFSPQKGIAARLFIQRQHKLKILKENILKLLFQLGEKEKNFLTERSIDEIIQKRAMEKSELKKGLRLLRLEGYVSKETTGWKLTIEGKEQGQRVTRLHRLWEMYLTEYLRIAPDHVHDDAESMEHIITPEIEQKLEEQLKHPKTDPHLSEIPYKS
ncbi:MAG TPA: iron chelate uptake ABC transporter family permease subunit [Cytophagaceae bacterium]|nr:iron chelate uptake ABC transporter family permease subunit [Cytophagaceae bacterium]